MQIIVADDHALFREGLRHVLGDLDDSLDVLEADTGRSALRLADQHPNADMVLLDLNMPDISGLAALKQLSERHPTLPVVVLTASTSRTDMQRALALGALGYIPKDATGPVMLTALRLVQAGGIFIPPALADVGSTAINGTPGNLARGDAANLTPRQRDVLQLLAQGQTNKQIARHCDLAEATVKMHVTAIFRALDVSNRTQAVIAAEQLGLLDDSALSY